MNEFVIAQAIERLNARLEKQTRTVQEALLAIADTVHNATAKPCSTQDFINYLLSLTPQEAYNELIAVCKALRQDLIMSTELEISETENTFNLQINK